MVSSLSLQFADEIKLSATDEEDLHVFLDGINERCDMLNMDSHCPEGPHPYLPKPQAR